LSTIRKANPGDAERLARIAERTFRDAFGALTALEELDVHCRASFGEAVQAGEISNPNMVTLLAEEEGDLVGFAQLRWDHAPDCVAARSPGEIQRLYVLGEWHGKGVAQGLMNASLEEMRKHGSDMAWLGVWERNPRALAFYKKLGFTDVGDQVFSLGSEAHRDIVMVRSVAGS
jgi:diamine N-acetyltransferase